VILSARLFVWLFGVGVVCFLAESVSLGFSQYHRAGFDFQSLLSPLMLTLLLLLFWRQFRGYWVFGATEATFRQGLHSVLHEIGLPFEESVAGFSLPSLDDTLHVSIQPWMGRADFRMRSGRHGEELKQIVRALRTYLRSAPGQTTILIFVVYAAIGFLAVASTVEFSFRSRMALEPDVSRLSATAKGLIQRVEKELGHGPDVFSDLSGNVTSLSLDFMELTDAEWSCLREFAHLDGLVLIGVPDIEKHLAAVAAIRSLRTLNLGGTFSRLTLSQEALREIGRMRELESLILSGVGLDDSGVKTLSSLRRLTLLRINNNPGVTDSAVDTLTRFPNLRRLSFAGTSISGRGIEQLKKDRPSLQLE